MTVNNIVVGAPQPTASETPKNYLIPLSFNNPTQLTEISVTIGTTSFNLLLDLDPLFGNLFVSAYTINKTLIYFASYKCVYNSFMNQIDNGCPYLFFFVDQSNGLNYSKNSLPITYDALNNGVKLYAQLRPTL
jgi:hypothetical protein